MPQNHNWAKVEFDTPEQLNHAYCFFDNHCHGRTFASIGTAMFVESDHLTMFVIDRIVRKFGGRRTNPTDYDKRKLSYADVSEPLS